MTDSTMVAGEGVPRPAVLPDLATLRAMHAAVLDWYAATARPLAFRGTADPYAILVSELMAQQTQAARAAAAWHGFLRTFPTFEALAAATPAAVVRAWRGLGYNRRALALRRIAIAVVAEHGGRLPEDLAALERLPGVGPYTARAIAALAFGQAVGPVDTNVRRVLRRALWGLDPSGPNMPSPRALQAVADAVVPDGKAGAWTHALMDVGATLCRPRSPRCASCPMQPWCRAANRPVAWESGAEGPADVAGPQPRANGARRTAEVPMAFEASSRWLRGRIVDRLCEASDGAWVALGDGIGQHDAPALDAALEGLRADGLVERHPSLARHARLPIA